MERKTSTVLLMMLSVAVIFVLAVGAGFVLMTDYEATVCKYDVTGTHEYISSNDLKMQSEVFGTVTTTHMYVFDMEKTVTVSDISYEENGSMKKYDLGGKWSFFSNPEIGELYHQAEDLVTPNHGIIPVNVYVHESGQETIIRYIGQEDGMIYKVERRIVTVTEDDRELVTTITQNLTSYGDTLLPIFF